MVLVINDYISWIFILYDFINVENYHSKKLKKIKLMFKLTYMYKVAIMQTYTDVPVMSLAQIIVCCNPN